MNKRILSAMLAISLIAASGVPQYAWAEENVNAVSESESTVEELRPESIDENTVEAYLSEGIQENNQVDEDVLVAGESENTLNIQNSPDNRTANKCGENATWTLSNGVLHISGTGDMQDYSENAPWFDQKNDIISIEIDDGITSIGSFAFAQLENLSNVSMADSIIHIKDYAFFDCSKLQKISLSKNLQAIWNGTFGSCDSLQEIDMPNSVIFIGVDAFAYCKSLKKVKLSSGLTEITNRSFSNCTGLEEIEFPKGVQLIDQLAFMECVNLNKIILPISVKQILGAFIHCENIHDVYYEGTEADRSNIEENVGEIRFDNGSLNEATWHYETTSNVTLDPVEAFVSRLYKNILGRDADASGLKAWSDVLKSGKEQGAKVAQGFVDSQEMKNRKLSDDDYIKALYQTFLNREADAAGLAAWKNVLDSGLSRMHVFKGFAESQEFTEICEKYGIIRGNAQLTAPCDQNEGVTKFIVRNYRLCLGRNADEDGLNGWCNAILTGQNTAKQAAHGFVFSDEFKKKNLSDTEYVKTLYRVFMDREADGAGLEAWVKVLKNGQSREHVFNGFADSNEFREICARYGIK